MAREQSAAGTLAVPGGVVVPAGLRQPAGFSRWLRRHWLDVAMVAPLVIYIVFFMFVPVGQSIYLSFVAPRGGALTFDNYREVVAHSQFQAAFVNTIGITVMGVTMEMSGRWVPPAA